MNSSREIATGSDNSEDETKKSSVLSPRLASSAPIQITLIGLYSMPLIMLCLTPFFSAGYSQTSVFAETTFRVVTMYVTDLRDAFAVFVVPFVTAVASGRLENSTSGGLKPIQTFFIFISMLIASILLGAYMRVTEEDMMRLQTVGADQARVNVSATLSIVDSYVKEVLTYISLFLGISVWKNQQ